MTQSDWLAGWTDLDIPLWAGLPPDARAELFASLETIALRGGTELFAQGDPADALYVLAAGSIGISSVDQTGLPRRIARIAPPETVGEMAMLSDAPRSATAVALRDSIVLRLSRTDFDRLIERWPSGMVYIARLLADRLRARTRGEPPPRPASTVAIIAVTAGVTAERLGRALSAEVSRWPGVRAIVLESPTTGADEAWFHQLETKHHHVFYVSSTPSGGWADLCRRRADHLLLVAAPGEPTLLQAPWDHPASAEWRKSDLVVIQDGREAIPRAPHPSVCALSADLHLNIRSNDPEGVRRLARVVAGRAVGIVLSGGGARGFAHIGVLLALQEVGQPIDFAGGTSIGAIIAAALASGWPIEEIKERIRDAFVADPPLDDFTLPLVALLRGHKVDTRLSKTFGDLSIERLWLPFFCVSSNLTSGQAQIHTQGSLVRALRASIAIPGLLPPVVEPCGVLVDGAMMNNLPIDVMADLQRGPVIAVDVARDLALQARAGRSFLRQVFGLSAEAPSIASLLLRAATVSSDAQLNATRSRATLLLQPPLAEIGLRSWRSFDQAVEIGYRYAVKALQEVAADAG